MTIYHNSRHTLCRTPFGAAVCGCAVTLRLLVGDCDWPDSVSLVYMCDEAPPVYIKMHYHSVVAGMTVYEAVLNMPPQPCLVQYYFEMKCGPSTVYYGNNPDCMGGVGYQTDDRPKTYQITVYDQGYHTPDWFKHGVMYQIFPDRFAKSYSYDSLAKRDDIIQRKWGDMPYYKPKHFGGEYLANDCFGGSLEGIIEKLPYLADLGVSIIYLNPIFEAFSNHKYDTGDYEKIDIMFGDEQIFSTLCAKANELGIKIILDGVFNHTGSDSKYFNIKGKYPTVGAYQSRDSQYFDWYRFDEFPNKYECWWGIKTLPHVNEDAASYMDYILSGKDAIIKKWIRLGAAGWRLDVVDELPEEFLKTLRRELKSEKSDAVIIGEVWEDASNKRSYGKLRHYLGGHELDSAMNYPLRAAMINFIIGNIGGKEFYERVMCLYENYPKEAFFAMMNFLGSHDTTRILTAVSDSPNEHNMSCDMQAEHRLADSDYSDALRRLRLITAMQMTLPGVPCVYYGDEAGMQGYSDPFCRQCFPWENMDTELHDWFKHTIAMRRSSHAFFGGEFDMVYGEGRTCGFVRYCEVDGKCEFKLVVVNADPVSDWFAWIELGRFGINEICDTVSGEQFRSGNGRFGVSVAAMKIRIFDGNL